ncbi:hypothetical protein [Methanogenium sp. MK-MG]|uniref:hypothetical protein n=1 Tax=Methanogenium sp. MK-MG TaxID=2599926 RepID=UPI0013ED7711|nr:hypothetical protein [Methanogenium sp. MK-MG]
MFGGDHASADAMMQHVVQNRVRTEEMNRLIDECGCDPETAAILREQVQAMEQEQARFEGVAAAENGRRGLFGHHSRFFQVTASWLNNLWITCFA